MTLLAKRIVDSKPFRGMIIAVILFLSALDQQLATPRTQLDALRAKLSRSPS